MWFFNTKYVRNTDVDLVELLSSWNSLIVKDSKELLKCTHSFYAFSQLNILGKYRLFSTFVVFLLKNGINAGNYLIISTKLDLLK